MKTMKLWRIMFMTLAAIVSLGTMAQTSSDSIIVHGRVTDFNVVPIDSCSVCWMNEQFETITQAISDSNGFYTATIRKGIYNSVAAIYEPSYTHNASINGLPESNHRLEFWAWNFIADRDTTLNIRYHRMEAYGIHAFYIPGAVPTFQIYVRPMSLTRTLEWMKKQKPKTLLHGEDLRKVTQKPVTRDARLSHLAPSLSEIVVRVEIDGEDVDVLHKQEIEEYVNANETMNAYLLTVNRPHNLTNRPYWVIKVELSDLQNGDCGEGLYYMEKPNYTR